MTRMVLNNARLAYTHLDEPRAAAEGAEPKYSTTLIIPKDHPQVAEIKAAMKEAVSLKWGAAVPKGIRSPLRDGDDVDPDTKERIRGPEFANSWFLSVSSKRKPEVVVGKNRTAPEPEHLISGHYGAAMVGFFAYDIAGNRGVGAGLNKLWITRKGEPLGVAAEAWNDSIEAEDFGGIIQKAAGQGPSDDDIF